MKLKVIIAFGAACSAAHAELREDGSKFMIDMPFEVKHFKVWGEKKPDTWGFVSENMLPLNHKGYNEVLLLFRII